MSLSEAFFLGLLQGLTEFFPISSSGHLVIATHFFGLAASQNLLVILLFHIATALSIVVVFYSDIWHLIKDLMSLQWNDNTKLACKLLVSAIPIFIVGVFFSKQVEYFFAGNIPLVAIMMFVTAILLFLSYKKKETNKNIDYKKSFLLGVCQTLAILPGLSRSGATIAIGILLGCNRKQVTQFSFLMLLVPVLGGGFLQLLQITNKVITIPMSSLLVGFVTSFIVGSFCCWWMKRLVQKNRLIYFCFYCLILSGFLFLL